MSLRLWSLALALLLGTATLAPVTSAQTPAVGPAGGEWWTAWSSCPITPVNFGSGPDTIPGLADPLYWLQAETTNDSMIEMIVWLWTGDRPLPVNGQYASDGTNAKWLWAFSEPMMDPIAATVTSETGAMGEVQFGGAILGSSTGPINGWPSFAIVPEPGCWTFDITATAQSGEVYTGRVVFPAVP